MARDLFEQAGTGPAQDGPVDLFAEAGIDPKADMPTMDEKAGGIGEGAQHAAEVLTVATEEEADAIIQVATLDRAHPDWCDVVASPAFIWWLCEQDPGVQQAASGDAALLALVIAQFKRAWH